MAGVSPASPWCSSPQRPPRSTRTASARWPKSSSARQCLRTCCCCGAARNMQHATRNMQHAARHMQHATRSTQHAACNTQHAARSTQHAARSSSTQHATRSTQHATRSTRHACWFTGDNAARAIPLGLILGADRNARCVPASTRTLAPRPAGRAALSRPRNAMQAARQLVPAADAEGPRDAAARAVAHSCAPGRVLADRPRRPIRSLGRARVRLVSLVRPDQLG